MDIKIDRKKFILALNKVNSVVEKNSNQLILRNVLLDVADGKLSLVSCDTQAQVMASIDLIECGEDYRTTVNCQKLLDIIKQLPDGDIHIFFKKGDTTILNVVMGKSKFKLATIESDQYPQIDFEQMDNSASIKVKRSILVTMLSKISFCMGTRDSREFLNACLFHLENDKLILVASDSHRISKMETAIENVGDSKFLVPRKSILELIKLLSTSRDENIDILFTDSLVRVTTDTFDFISSLINARYPDYTRVLPKLTEQDAHIQINKIQIKNSCSRVSILSNESHMGVYVDFEENNITLTTSNPSQESAKEVLPAKCKNIPTENIYYNVIYFIEAIGFCSNDEVELYVVNSKDSSKKNASVFIYKDDECYGESIVLPIRDLNY